MADRRLNSGSGVTTFHLIHHWLMDMGSWSLTGLGGGRRFRGTDGVKDRTRVSVTNSPMSRRGGGIEVREDLCRRSELLPQREQRKCSASCVPFFICPPHLNSPSRKRGHGRGQSHLFLWSVAKCPTRGLLSRDPYDFKRAFHLGSLIKG
uniref:Uncharacterized protein n=1 Tax=Knipowitschia caucasica TaxID=637954 RepID=A0AAV2MB90_KNICA